MAFVLNNLNNTSSGQADAPKLWAYKSSSDTLATCVADGYFNDVINGLSVDDLMYLAASDGSGYYRVTSVTTNVSLEAQGDSVSDLVTVTAAEMLALAASPKTLVAAPGAGKVLRFSSIELYLDYNSTAYTITAGGDDLSVRYTDGSGAIVSQTLQTADFLDATADAYLQGEAVNELGGNLADHANEALVLDNIGANEFTNGDSPVYVRVHYKIQSVPF